MTRNYQAETASSITALARRIIMTNLCKEIVSVQPMPDITYRVPKLPQPKYQFSRAKWHTADTTWILGREYNEIIAWCTDQFGPHPRRSDAWSRWWVGTGQIYFRDEKDYLMFVLRWA